MATGSTVLFSPSPIAPISCSSTSPETTSPVMSQPILAPSSLPDLSAVLSELRELNLTNNEFYGRVPFGLLKKFGSRSITRNEGLCEPSPLPVCSFLDVPPAVASAQTVVSSNPSSLPTSTVAGLAGKEEESWKGLSIGSTVAIVVANSVVVLLVVTSFVVAYYCGGNSRDNGSDSSSKGRRRSSGNSGDNKMRKQFELEDLLWASTEMLGKGSLGTVYKAMLEDGCTVAVKRLKNANPCARKEFEQYMGLIRKLRHPNLVHLRAYY
uniref:Protein kinase domain-containing protein n=1 Tax=Nelumbo nucifera TaxID=4432 RepID=A0A822Y422_NELNU|nr:TPA_asm: hypothetical protein HUJ06_027527 [Nelumbo nucifera]